MNSFNVTIENSQSFKLIEPIDLQGDWVMAITEISFTNSLLNITENQYIKILHYNEETIIGTQSMIEAKLVPGFYYFDDLIKQINIAICKNFFTVEGFYRLYNRNHDIVLSIPEIKSENNRLYQVPWKPISNFLS